MSMPLPSAPPRWPWADTPACIVAATRPSASSTLQPAVESIHRRLKQQFDPQGIFNPGRLYASL
jgi:hypothetical protein